MTIRCAIIDTGTGNVVNVIEYAAIPDGVPPGMTGNLIAVAHDRAGPGWRHQAGLFVAPVAPPPPVIAPPTLDELYDQAILTQRFLKGLVLALNDGSFVVGGNKTGAQIKAIIKAKM